METTNNDFIWENQSNYYSLFDWIAKCVTRCDRVVYRNCKHGSIKPDGRAPTDKLKSNNTRRQLFLPNLQGDARFRKSNDIKTSKYNLINFIPRATLLQFRRFSNVFYTCILILGLVGHYVPHLFLVSYHPWGTLSILMCVIVVTLIMEARDDIARHQADRRAGKQSVKVLSSSDFTFESSRWSKLRPGQVIRVHENELIPADVLIVGTSNESHRCLVETSGIDGETSLKQRIASHPLRDIVEQNGGYGFLHGRLTFDAPNSLMQFSGTFESSSDQLIKNFMDSNQHERFAQSPFGNSIGSNVIHLNDSNIMLRGSTLRNTQFVDAIVLYTGHDTKIALCNSDPPSKFGIVEREANSMMGTTVLIYCILVLLADFVFCFVTLSTDSTPWYLRFASDLNVEFVVPIWLAYLFTFCGLFSIIVPLNLYVCLELACAMQAYFIRQDIKLYDNESDSCTRVNTGNLVPDLGCVTHIVTDKTGTLTRNEMHVVGLMSGEREFGSSFTDSQVIQEVEAQLAVRIPSVDDAKLHEVLLVLSVCHTVQVVRESSEALNPNEVPRYSGTSQDELALVEYAAKAGYIFHGAGNESSSVRVWNRHKQTWIECKVYGIHNFHSSRMRMSIVVKVLSTNDVEDAVWVLCKGADSVIVERCNNYDETTATSCRYVEQCANQGYRTLLLAKRVLTADEFQTWTNIMSRAERTTGLTKEHELESASKVVEDRLSTVGAVAIKDELQFQVPESLVVLQQHGFRVWMATGDKTTTAVNVAINAKLISANANRIELSSEIQSELEAQIDSMLQKLCCTSNKNNNAEFNYPNALTTCESAAATHYHNTTDSMNEQRHRLLEEDRFGTSTGFDATLLPRLLKTNKVFKDLVVVVSGKALELLLASQAGTQKREYKFLALASKCSAVIVSRASPIQKALLTESIRVAPSKFTGIDKPMVLAIGDGGNDVPMIQKANVGVGMKGREGEQAVNNGDFGIADFHFVVRLILTHGIGAHNRNLMMIRYITYSWHVLAYQVLFYLWTTDMSGQSTFYSPYYVTLYAWISNSVILVIAVLDRKPDTSKKQHVGFFQTASFGMLSLRALLDATLVTGAAWMYVPMTITLEEYSCGIYTMVILVMAVRQLMICQSFTVIVVLCSLAALLFWLGMITLVDGMSTQAQLLFDTSLVKGWLPGAWVISVIVLLEMLTKSIVAVAQ